MLQTWGRLNKYLDGIFTLVVPCNFITERFFLRDYQVEVKPNRVSCRSRLMERGQKVENSRDWWQTCPMFMIPNLIRWAFDSRLHAETVGSENMLSHVTASIHFSRKTKQLFLVIKNCPWKFFCQLTERISRCGPLFGPFGTQAERTWFHFVNARRKRNDEPSLFPPRGHQLVPGSGQIDTRPQETLSVHATQDTCEINLVGGGGVFPRLSHMN